MKDADTRKTKGRRVEGWATVLAADSILPPTMGWEICRVLLEIDGEEFEWLNEDLERAPFYYKGAQVHIKAFARTNNHLYRVRATDMKKEIAQHEE